MAIEAPPNIMKAGERPARVRTGAKTATKGQERAMLDKLEEVALHPEYLVPEWLGSGRSPFAKLDRKLRKVQARRHKPRRLRWMARGKRLWHGYAASLVALSNEKIPSFASLKFQGRDVKYVYRSGTGRQALIGVQHYDDPQVRLLGYTDLARKHRVYIVSGEERFVAASKGTTVAPELLSEFLSNAGVGTKDDDGVLRCDHATGTRWRYRYDFPGLGWKASLCMDCLQKLGGTFNEFLDKHVLGPDKRLDVKRQVRGHAYTIRPEASVSVYEGLIDQAFERAKKYASDNFVQYSDIELAQWTRDELQKLLKDRPEGFLLIGEDLWLTAYDEAAKTYTDSDMEQRALTSAFKHRPPALRVSDKSLHKILEPFWADHGGAILAELAGGLLKEQELSQIQRLNPSEALASLARILGARERFKEFIQFDDLDPVLDFVVTCFQIHRSGEHRVLAQKLHSGAADEATRAVALALARNLGEQAQLEWQYAAHEKDAASFLEPYVRDVLNATPQKFSEAIGKLAVILGVPAPTRKATAAT